MLSLRVWLERFPGQVRLVVALLAMLSFVAPTWHVCSMGGHVLMGGAHAMARMDHEPFLQSKSGALICFCAPKPAPTKQPTPFHWNAHMNMSHDASCLALMLSAMPALLVSRSQLEVAHLVWFRPFFLCREFPARQFIRTFCGRGPPCESVRT